MRDSAPAGAVATAHFANALDRSYAALYAFARNLLNDGEEARDVVQDVFAEAWRTAQAKKPPFGEESSDADVRRWLFRVAYHRAISLRRHQRVIAWESLDLLHPLAHHERDGAPPFEDRVAEGEALRAAFNALELQEAACVLLKFVYGFNAPEIARILEIAPDAARKRLSRAMQRLRASYFAQEPERASHAPQRGSRQTQQTTEERLRS